MTNLDKFKTDILPYQRGQNLTREEFDAMFQGETRTKFKMIVDPDNGKLYRLVIKGEGIPSHYAEMEPKPTLVYEYALSDGRKEEYRQHQLEPLKQPYSIRSYRIQVDPKKSPAEGELSRLQFFELEKAVSLSSRWWPLEGLAWNSLDNLKNTQVNILFKENMPIGFIAVEDCGEKHGQPVKAISMLGLIPGQRGSGHGSYLMKWALKNILTEFPEAHIMLSTSDLDKKQNGKSARELYEKLGFVEQSSHLVDTAKIIAENKNTLGTLDLYNAYAPDTYDEEPGTGRKLPRFTQAELERRLGNAFGVREKTA